MLIKNWGWLRNSNLLCVKTNYQKCMSIVRPILEYASVVWDGWQHYKMHTNIVPYYLCDTIANFRKNAQYNTRNEESI